LAFKDLEWLFQPGAPIAQLDRETRPKDRLPVKQALHLLSRAPRTENPGPLSRLSRLLLTDEVRIRRDGEDITDFILALVAVHYQRAQIEAPRDLEDATARASTPLNNLPGHDEIARMFASAPIEQRRQILQDLLGSGDSEHTIPYEAVRLAGDFA